MTPIRKSKHGVTKFQVYIKVQQNYSLKSLKSLKSWVLGELLSENKKYFEHMFCL